MADMAQIARAVEGGRRKVVDQLVREALAEGVKAETILNEGLVVGMTNLGEQFKNGEASEEQYRAIKSVRSRGSRRGTRDEDGNGDSQAPAGGGERSVAGNRGHRHRRGRLARYRQEPRGHDA